MATKRAVEQVSGSPVTISQRYGIGESTVRRAIREKKLKASRCGRRVVVRFVDADAWIGRAR